MYYKFTTTDLALTILFSLCLITLGLIQNSVIIPLMLFICILISINDIHTYRIPNRLVLILSLFALVFSILHNDISLLNRLLGPVIVMVIFILPVYKGSFGMGDIKLILPWAFILGSTKIITALFISLSLSGFMGIVMILAGKIKKRDVVNTPIPFGPYFTSAVIYTLYLI